MPPGIESVLKLISDRKRLDFIQISYIMMDIFREEMFQVFVFAKARID